MNSKEMDEITGIVESYYRLEIGACHNKTRKQEIRKARQVASYLLRLLEKYTFEVIGDYFNQKYPTARHSFTVISNEIQTNNKLYQEVNDLTILIKNNNSITHTSKIEQILSGLTILSQQIDMMINKLQDHQYEMGNIKKRLNKIRVDLDKVQG